MEPGCNPLAEEDWHLAGAAKALSEYAMILAWLLAKICRQGKQLRPRDLVMQVKGKPLGADGYLAGITAKYRGIYGI